MFFILLYIDILKYVLIIFGEIELNNMIRIPDRRKPRNIPPLSRREKLIIYLRDGGRCVYCGNKLDQDNFSVDHFIPKSTCGTNSHDNLLTCCISTNNFFSNMHPGKKLQLLIKSKGRKLNCKDLENHFNKENSENERTKSESTPEKPS